MVNVFVIYCKEGIQTMMKLNPMRVILF